jgi:hypothetical protein
MIASFFKTFIIVIYEDRQQLMAPLRTSPITNIKWIAILKGLPRFAQAQYSLKIQPIRRY